MADKKKIIITKKLNNVLYEMIPKTHSDMVYVDKKYDVTLTEKLYDMCELLQSRKEDIDDIRVKYDEIVGGSPESFNTFKEVWDYVNINGDPTSELINLIESKQAAEEGKGLSTNDFTDYLYQKLKNGYSKEELDKKFNVIDTRFERLEETIEQNNEELNKKIDDEIDTREDEDDIIKDRLQRHNTFMSKMSPTELDGVEDNTTWYKIVSEDE